MCAILFFFFFSSRRRHTRLTCDWSLDVCSSDLLPLSPGQHEEGGEAGEDSTKRIGHILPPVRLQCRGNEHAGPTAQGEECRQRIKPHEIGRASCRERV